MHPVTEATEEAAGGGLGSEPVNVETLRALLQQLYPGRDTPTWASLSEFAEEIATLNYTSIQDLGIKLQGVTERLYRHEKDVATTLLMWVPYFDQLGLARTALWLADPNYENLKQIPRPPSDSNDR
jgi:hypothetical protein